MTLDHRSLCVVLHDLGDGGAGAPWAAAFGESTWPGRVLAPDLPGHRGTPPPRGGVHELADPAFVFAGLGLAEPVDLVVGIGASGLSALLVALGGRARSVAVVDGLGHPWRDTTTRVDETRRRLRRLASLDPRAGPGDDGLDPALATPPPPHGDLDFAQKVVAALDVRLLAVETSVGSGPSPLDDLRGHLPRGAAVELIEDRSPRRVAEVVARWSTQAG